MDYTYDLPDKEARMWAMWCHLASRGGVAPLRRPTGRPGPCLLLVGRMVGLIRVRYRK